MNHDVASTDECASTDGAASTDGGASTDGASGDEAASSNDGGDDLEYQEVAADSTIDVSKVKKPKRVLVFTIVVMLGLLAVCKNGSVDGIFKAMSRKWKQLFIFMVDYRGAFLPVTFSWLPDKHAISYHISLLLTLSKFKQEQFSIMKLYGRGTLKVNKIKLNFELAIHRAFEPLFKLKGCFFRSPHYQSVFPTRPSSLLKLVRENDGYDVCSRLGFQVISAVQFLSMYC